MKLTVALACALFFVATAAAEEPTGFDGLPWGSSPAKVREVLRNRCSVAGSDHDGIEVCEGYSLADVIGRLTLVNLPSRGLAAWRFDCPQADAARLARLITTRVGPARNEGPYLAYWVWPTTTVSLAKRDCSVVVATREGAGRLEELERDRAARMLKESETGDALTGYGGKRSSGKGG